MTLGTTPNYCLLLCLHFTHPHISAPSISVPCKAMSLSTIQRLNEWICLDMFCYLAAIWQMNYRSKQQFKYSMKCLFCVPKVVSQLSECIQCPMPYIEILAARLVWHDLVGTIECFLSWQKRNVLNVLSPFMVTSCLVHIYIYGQLKSWIWTIEITLVCMETTSGNKPDWKRYFQLSWW